MLQTRPKSSHKERNGFQHSYGSNDVFNFRIYTCYSLDCISRQMSYNTISPKLIDVIETYFTEQKFTDNDNVIDFLDSAISYMKENVENGTASDFVMAMNIAYANYKTLRVGQIRGLLNCIRAEVLSADKQANQIIDQIKLGIQPLDLRTVPSGRYAVMTADDHATFYVIDNIVDARSKWKDWVFVSLMSSDNKIKVGSQRPGQTYQGQHQKYLQTIKDDPYSASTLFGRMVGSCGICGRTLTDPESIENGIGPICAQKVGWMSEFDRGVLKALGFGKLLEKED